MTWYVCSAVVEDEVIGRDVIFSENKETAKTEFRERYKLTSEYPVEIKLVNMSGFWDDQEK